MAKAGDVIENPLAGERFVFRKTARDTNGELLQFDLFVKPHGAVPVEHIHPLQEERFEVISGTVKLRVDGQERTLCAGDDVVVPPGAVHYWWNGGDDEFHVRIEVRPAMRFETFLETVCGLARDGKTNETGGPPNVLMAAVLFSGRFKDHIYLARPSIPVQKTLFKLLRPLGRLVGYRDDYPEYASAG